LKYIILELIRKLFMLDWSSIALILNLLKDLSAIKFYQFKEIFNSLRIKKEALKDILQQVQDERGKNKISVGSTLW